METPVKVGISFPYETLLGSDPQVRSDLFARVNASGLDHFTVGDHISFHGGVGFDGVVSATMVMTAQLELPVIMGIYMLGLRHPVLAARQLVTMNQLAPGRFVLGVGVGGEDRSEIANSGVDPSTRGRRLDEVIDIVRELMKGEPVSYKGEFFTLDNALILPPMSPMPPIVIGGKGETAVRRTAERGDGWLGIFCSANRFAITRQEIFDMADSLGRPRPWWFGMNMWCGLDLDSSRARSMVGEQMEALYQLPPEKFQHLVPAGTPQEVAEFLLPYVQAGAEYITLVPVAESVDAMVDHSAEVARILKAL